MAANRTISIRLTVAEADQFKQVLQGAGASGAQSLQLLTAAANQSSTALQHHTQTAGLANYQIIELTESAHKFADIILSGGSAIRGLEFELPKFIGIAGGVTQALGAVGKALPLLGIAAAAAGIYELGKAANDQQSRMALLGQQVRATRDDYDSYAASLEKTARQLAQHSTLSTADARTTVNAIGNNVNFSGSTDGAGSDLNRLAKDAQNLSVVLKTDLAGGTKVITDGLNNAAKAAKELEEKGFKGFDGTLVRNITNLQQAGKFSEAFSLFLQTLEARSKGAADAGLTPLGTALKRLDESLKGTRENAHTWSEAIGGFFDSLAIHGIDALTRLIEKAEQVGPAVIAAFSKPQQTQFGMVAPFPTSSGRNSQYGPFAPPGMFKGASGGDQPSATSASDYNAMRDRLSREYGVDPDLIARLNNTEGHRSADGSWQTSSAGAVGGFQVKPDTFAQEQQKYGFAGKITDDEANARAGILYYRDQLQNRGGDATSAYYDYHDGPAAQHTSAAAISAAQKGGIAGYSGDALTGYTSDGMINTGRKTDEALNGFTEGTRGQVSEKLAATLEGIEKQLQAFETSGRQNTIQYTELVQREQSTKAAIYNNVDPQTQATREGQNALDTQRLARRYGFTPADQQLAAQAARRQEIARTTGVPATQADTDADTSQAYTKATMELTRLEQTQARTVVGNEALAAAYAKSGVAVADYTAKNEAQQIIGNTLFSSASDYQQQLDKLTVSLRRVAQSTEDMRAAEQSANDNKGTAATNEQLRLLNSGEGTNQQAQDFAAFQARQANQTASPSAQDGVAEAARQRVQADQALSSTKANYAELQSFGSNTFDRLGSSMTSAFTSSSNAAKSFSNIALSAVSDVSQELMKLAVLDPLKNAVFGGNSPTLTGTGGILGSLLGIGGASAFSTVGATQSAGEQAFVSAAGAGASSGGGLGSFFSGLFHSGGIVGSEGGSRWVDPSVFYRAPRYHQGGIAGDEVPAVLQAGEAVLTPGQMAALGKGIGSGNSGGDTHFNFNVNAQGAGPREIDQLKAQIPLIALQATQQAAQRGGSYAKAMRGG